MKKLFTGNAIWQLIAQSDMVSILVLLVLLTLSIVSWTVFLYKILVLRAGQRKLREAQARLRNVTTVDQLSACASQYIGTDVGYFMSSNLENIKFLLSHKSHGAGLERADLDILEQKVYTMVDDIVISQEAYTPALSTSAAISPLLGLFGTVWGLVHAFVRISEQQSADITTVAPGIAEALITTLAGLMVAIPALALFNYIMTRIRGFEQQFNSFADLFLLRVQYIFVRVKAAQKVGADEHVVPEYAQKIREI